MWGGLEGGGGLGELSAKEKHERFRNESRKSVALCSTFLLLWFLIRRFLRFCNKQSY